MRGRLRIGISDRDGGRRRRDGDRRGRIIVQVGEIDRRRDLRVRVGIGLREMLGAVREGDVRAGMPVEIAQGGLRVAGRVAMLGTGRLGM